MLDVMPKTLKGLAPSTRDEMVISVVRDHQGNEYVLSRHRDMTWDLSPLPWPRNRRASDKRLIFPVLRQPKLVVAIKDALYARWRIGLVGYPILTANSVVGIGKNLTAFIRWLDDRGIVSLAEVTSALCLEYAAYCRSLLGRKGTVNPKTTIVRLRVVEILWSVRNFMEDGLGQHPWPGETAQSLAGLSKAGGYKRMTEAIPDVVAGPLFIEAERVLNRAEALLDARDIVESIRGDVNKKGHCKSVFNRRANACIARCGLLRLRQFREELLRVRGGIYILLGITTGMRDHELASLKSGAFYTSKHDGEVYGWLRGHSSKTHAGDVEWMVPIELIEKAIATLDRLSAPLRAELDAHIATLEARLTQADLDSPERQELAVELHSCREHAQHLFLGKDRKTGNIRTLSGKSVGERLKGFARRLGLNWNLHPHQFRATFAEYVAGSVHGDLRYLKKHYKHWTMDMTLLYAINRKQDEELYQDVYDALHEFNMRVIDHWLDDCTPLSGGAAERIKIFRRDKVKTFASHKEMVESLSEQIVIRNAGHSWCMADLDGCGGLGLIDKGHCVYCNNGVIDDTKRELWEGIYRQQCELLELDDIGPGGRQRVLHDLRAAEKVLNDLGVPFEPAQVDEGRQ
jgi:integrase